MGGGAHARPWGPPITMLPAEAGLPAGLGWRGVASFEGPISSFQLWIAAPQSWLDVTVRINARTDAGTLLLERKLVGDAAFLQSTGNGVVPAQAGAEIRGLLFDTVGLQCTGVTVEALMDTTERAQATFTLMVSGAPPTVHGDRVHQPAVMPFAFRHQEFQFTGELDPANNPTLIVGEAPEGRRMYVTNVTLSTDEAASRVVILQTRNDPVGVTTPRRNWIVGGSAAPAIAEQFTYPLRSDRGDRYEFTVSGLTPGRFILANVIGFVE